MGSKLVTARARMKQGKVDEAKELYQQALDTATANAAEERKTRKGATPKRRDQKQELTAAQQTAPKALAGLAAVAQMKGDEADALRLIERVRKEHTLALKELPDVQKAMAQLELLLFAGYGHKPSAHYTDLIAAAAADDKETHARLELQLAAALFLEGVHKEAVELILNHMRRHRGWGDGAAKKCAVAAFTVLGGKHEVTQQGRKRMMVLM